MKKITVYSLFAVVFIVLCLVPSLGMLIFGPAESSANEILALKPSLTYKDGSINYDVLVDTGDYLADRFFLRKELITLWSKLQAKVFRSSANSQVLLGKEGWLFYEETVDDYMGRTLSDEELVYIAHNLSLMEEYAQSRGAEFLFTIAPDKNSIYSEYMPDYIAKGADSDAHALIRLLKGSNISHADLFNSFAHDEQLYYTDDSHWNVKGAAIAADEILSALGRDSSFGSAGFTYDSFHRGDLYDMLYPADSYLERDYSYAPGFSFTSSKDPKGGETINFDTENKTGHGSLLCFRDSFGNALYPYLAESFEHASFSRNVPYDLTKLDSSDTDTLIIELVERNLSNLITTAPVMASPMRDMSETRQGSGIISIKAENGKTQSTSYLVNISGDLSSIQCGDISNICIRSGERVYEAFITCKDGAVGFSAYLPKSDDASYYVIINSTDGAFEYSTEY